MTNIWKYLLTVAAVVCLAACNDDSEFYYTTSYPVVNVEVSVAIEEEIPEPEPEPEPGGEEEGGETGGGTDGGNGNPTGIRTGAVLCTGNTGTSGRGISGYSSGTVTDGRPGSNRHDASGDRITARSSRKTSGSNRLGAARSDAAVPAEESGTATENPLIVQIRDEVLAAAPVQAGGSYTLDFKYFSSGRLTVRPMAGAEAIRGGFEKIPGSSDLRFFFGDNAYTCATSTYAMKDGTSATLLTIDFTEVYQALYPDAKIKQVLRLEYTSHRD